MKYEELVLGLDIVRSKVILNYSGVLFEHIYKGITKFGKVYVYPEPYHKEVKAIEDKEYYGINIEEKLWIFLSPLLTDFDVENLNPNAPAFCITLKTTRL